MPTPLKRHKKLRSAAFVLAVLLLGWLYRELRPTIIFHTPQESRYLGKVVCTVSGDQDKLYIANHVARYRLPHVWNWKEEDEVAIFTRNYDDLIQKADLDFWKLDVYLTEDGFYKSHTQKEYCWGLRHIFQTKTNEITDNGQRHCIKQQAATH